MCEGQILTLHNFIGLFRGSLELDVEINCFIAFGVVVSEQKNGKIIEKLRLKKILH